MKTVTVEAVRARLSYLEELNARGVGTAVESQQFELACLRELFARMESRTVTVKLKEPFKLAKSSSCLTYYYADEVDKALADAGINVEVE